MESWREIQAVLQECRRRLHLLLVEEEEEEKLETRGVICVLIENLGTRYFSFQSWGFDSFGLVLHSEFRNHLNACLAFHFICMNADA